MSEKTLFGTPPSEYQKLLDEHLKRAAAERVRYAEALKHLQDSCPHEEVTAELATRSIFEKRQRLCKRCGKPIYNRPQES